MMNVWRISHRKYTAFVRIFDRGVGIPETLKQKSDLQRLLEYFQLSASSDDASLIAAATELGKTSTGRSHQGCGLPDIKKFVQESEKGTLRILSLRGVYVYNSHGETHRSLLPSSIGGTLVEWEITLQ